MRNKDFHFFQLVSHFFANQNIVNPLSLQFYPADRFLIMNDLLNLVLRLYIVTKTKQFYDSYNRTYTNFVNIKGERKHRVRELNPATDPIKVECSTKLS